MSESCIIGVPAEDESEIRSLAKNLGLETEFPQQRYFDGSLFTEIVIPLVTSGTAWLTLRTWINARSEVLKATRVTYRGVEITGMKPKDADRIIRLLTNKQEESDVD